MSFKSRISTRRRNVKFIILGLSIVLVEIWLPQYLYSNWLTVKPKESVMPVADSRTTTTTSKHPPAAATSTKTLVHPSRSNRSMSTTDMFVSLSDMLPEFRGSCPNLPRYRAQWFDLRDLRLCYNVMLRASDRKACIIYNFGVGKSDPFLKYLSMVKHLHCQVYAFDPFISPDRIKMKFGKNIQFYEIGLWNGQSDRIVGSTGTGRLMTLSEIQTMLNHSTDTRITLFRSDCEGCEYGWIKHAMDHEESFFERIDQMFIEIHTVPIRYMSSIELEWQRGMPPDDLLEPVYQMLTKYFRVLHAAVNPGGLSDRDRVPDHLVEAGVLRYPCCRELNLINRKLAAPAAASPTESIHDAEHPVDCKVAKHGPIDFEGFGQEFRELFHGRHKTCPDRVDPTCVSDHHCYCPNILDKDAVNEQCHVYFFGNLHQSDDMNLLRQLYTSHPTCAIRVFDPRFDERSGAAWMNTHHMFDILFYPWGLYEGTGPRRVKQFPGEFYTLGEITTSWLKIQSVKRTIPNPRPSHISLMRIDWSMANPCEWQKDVLAHSSAWWGQYQGAETVQQLV